MIDSILGFFMRTIVFFLFLGTALSLPFSGLLQTSPQLPIIESPRVGDALQGIVTVYGSSDVAGFSSVEFSFAYSDDPTGTWFLISTSDQPVTTGALATWDTTIITDGNYILRMRVFFSDGTTSDATVSGLRVRNYTHVETPTPIPTAPEATSVPTLTPTETPFPTPTSLPRNPVELSSTNIFGSILYGGLAAILVILILIIYLWLRRK